MLSDEELQAIDSRCATVRLLCSAPGRSLHTLIEEDVPRLLADLRRYRDWCQRLVACADAIREDESVDGTLSMAEEVRAALEGNI